MSQEYGWRSTGEDFNQEGEACFLPQKKTRTVIIPRLKKYTREELDDLYVERQQKHEHENDPLSYLRDILKYKYESLGRSTMDGIEVAGFRSTDPNLVTSPGSGRPTNDQVDIKLWVDVKTLFPVRYEFEDFMQMEDNAKHYTRIVFSDFRWDVDVAATDFEPPIPDDYTFTLIKLPPNNEETAIQGLKRCVELFGRYPMYPERITDIYQLVKMVMSGNRMVADLPAERLQEEIKGLSEDEIENELLLPIRGLERFGCRLKWENKDLAYYGGTVTPKDSDKVLLRWKLSESEYRVIYGDLHAETVSPEKLAELEAALPK